MREIVFDTETTGLDPAKGDRVVEIGCIELLNGIPTGKTFHHYIDPERDMPDEAFRIHGISGAMLAGKPVFAEIAQAFADFTEGAKLVAHNAEFDFKFINAELSKLGHPILSSERMVDTLALARRRHPGAPASLDALCQRYGIDTSRRTKHGALLDAEILAEVYAELTGGKQTALVFGGASSRGWGNGARGPRRERPQPLAPFADEQETARHAAFVAEMGTKAIWYQYIAPLAEVVEKA